MSFFITCIINPGWLDNHATSGRLSISPGMGSGWLADFMLPWLGVLLVTLVGGEYWWMVIIPVGAHISFSLGYAWPTRHPLTGTFGLRCRNSLLFILLLLGFVAGYQAHLYKQLNPGVGVREDIDTWGLATRQTQ